MTVGVQRQKKLFVTTELVIWRYANAFLFTNQSEVDFGIGLVYSNDVRHPVTKTFTTLHPTTLHSTTLDDTSPLPI
jgi:hypothetical protein